MSDKKTEQDIPAPNSEIFKDSKNGFAIAADAKAHVVDGVQFNALGLESTADHKHVSKVWQDQCIPIDDFAATIEAQRVGKIDVPKPMSFLHLSDDLTLPDGMNLTRNGLMSMVINYTNYPSGSVAYHLEHGDNVEVAKFINRELDETRSTWAAKQEKKITSKFTGTEKDVLLRIRPDGDSQVVRMVASDRYGVLDNHEIMGMIIDAMKKTPYGGNMEKALASHTFSDLDKMYGNIIMPDDMKQYPDSDYGIGLAFGNSEIGRKTAKVNPFLFRSICSNGCIWGKKEADFKLSKKHLGEMNKTEIAERILYVCTVALNEGRDLMTQMEYSREALVSNDKIASVITYLTQQNKLTVAESRAWFAAFNIEPWDNGFGIINGLTRAAQKFSGDARWNLESTAGSILTPSLTANQDAVKTKWAKIVERASELTQKEVERYTRIAA